MGNVILSAFSDEYAESIEEQLFELKHFGFGHMEVRALNGKNISVMSREEVSEAKKQLDVAGIKVSAIGSPLGKIRLDEDMDTHMELAKRILPMPTFRAQSTSVFLASIRLRVKILLQ